MNRLGILATNIAWRLLKRGAYARPQLRRKAPVVVVPFAGAAPTTRSGPVAAVLHIYHPDMADPMKLACLNLKGQVDVYITTNEAVKAAEIRESFKGWSAGSINITVLPNRGRDMLSKFVAFVEQIRHYDLVLFLHSKRSDHIKDGQHDWGQVLTNTLAGSTAIVDSVFDMFEARSELGIVAPDHYDGVRKWLHWGRNRRMAASLSVDMGFDLDRATALDFPSGSMFWARPAALEPLLNLKLSVEDFPLEPVENDGTIAHALERLIFFSAELAGYEWVKVVTEQDFLDRGNRVIVRDRAGLSDTLARVYRPLLPGCARGTETQRSSDQ